MSKIVKSLVIAGAMTVASTAFAGGMSDMGFSPYVGAGYQHTWMKGKSDWNNLMGKSFPGFNLFVGTKFCDYLALELGYAATTSKSKDYTFAAGAKMFNVDAAGTAKTKVRVSGFNLDLNANYPVAEGFEAIGSVGFGLKKAKVTVTGLTAAPGFANNLLATKGKSKMTFRLGAGVGYMINEMVSVRGMARYENLGRLKVSTGTVAPKFDDNVKKAFKDGFSLGLDLVVGF